MIIKKKMLKLFVISFALKLINPYQEHFFYMLKDLVYIENSKSDQFLK